MERDTCTTGIVSDMLCGDLAARPDRDRVDGVSAAGVAERDTMVPASRRPLVRLAAGLLMTTLSLAGCASGSPAPSASGPAQPSRTLSAADERAIAERLAEVAVGNGVKSPPEVERVRVVSLFEQPSIIVNCLSEKGVSATLNPDGGGYWLEMPADQVDAVGLAAYTCEAQYPVDPAHLGPPTDEHKQVIFEYLTRTLVQCLEDEGFTIDDVPTRETFMSSFAEAPSFNPYYQVWPLLSAVGDADALERRCPPNTPPQLLYGQ